MRERIENIKREVEKTKKMPLLQKAGQAERVTGQAVVLLEMMADRLEELEQRINRVYPAPATAGGGDYFDLDRAFKAEKAGGTV